MKRKTMVLTLVLMFVAAVAAAESVTKSISSENTFTDPISPCYRSPDCCLNISISGTWSGTVTLQRKFSGDSTYYDVDTWTSNAEEHLFDFEQGVVYRIGVKTGDYTSGTVAVRLSK